MHPALSTLSEETEGFWVHGSVQRIHKPSPLQFVRDVMTAYHPIIITGLLDDWPAMQKWSLDYLRTQIQHDISINITPDGWGDCIKTLDCEERFVYPAEVSMKMQDFCDMISHAHEDDAVPYLSQQNDNFRTSFAHLMSDVAPSLPLANESFDCLEPEAMNIWIGDQRSVSSVHKDHFENMYAVITGEKTFTLLPPTDIAFMSEKTVKTSRYAVSRFTGRVLQSDVRVVNDGCPSEELTWITVNPDAPTDINSRFSHAHPLRCVVRPGEVLYIPAMWYHQVSQSKPTIAINYWYEQKFDFRFVFYQTVKAIVDYEEES